MVMTMWSLRGRRDRRQSTNECAYQLIGIAEKAHRRTQCLEIDGESPT